MRPLTLIPLALLGLSGTAFAQAQDETTSDLSMMLDDAEDGRQDRSRGSQRGNARRGGGQRQAASRGAQSKRSAGQVRGSDSFRQGARQNGDTRQMTRTDGDRQLTRTLQQRGDQTRTRTQGQSRDASRQTVANPNGQSRGARTEGVKTRTQSEITNGNKTVRWGEGSNSYREAARAQNGQGGSRKVGTHHTNTRTNMNVGNGHGGRHHSESRTTETTRRATNGTKTLESRVRTSNANSGHRHESGTHSTPHARPKTPARPMTPVRPHTPARPSAHVRPGASRPHSTRVITRSPNVHVRHGGHRHIRYTHVRPYHGVFVYGPPPQTHNHYHSRGTQTSGGQVKVKKSDLPQRFVDRENTLAVGLKGGSLWSGYFDANAYADSGLGLNVRYRPDEAVGLDVAIQHHDQTWNMVSERSQTMMSGSVELFAYPWTRVSPYALGGLTYTTRDIEDEIFQSEQINLVQTRQPLIGPHVGLGIEFALGKTVALDLEARYTGYLNRKPTDASMPGALTTTAGLMFHF
jgi:opacity protein-like surface antigen